MRESQSVPFRVAVALSVGVAPVAHDHAAMLRATAADAPSWQQKYDFFTNFGHYMPRMHCMVKADGTPDWPWIGVLLALNAVVIVGYLKIFRFWRQCHVAEAPADRNRKLMDLAGIFLLCATCGYGFFILTTFWPGYRLLVLFMIGLSIFTWRFAADLESFRLTFSAKRLERELRESLLRRNEELEGLVTSRTRELERAIQFKGDFLANMSHELRTPMTAILGFADLLADPAVESGEQVAYVETIRRNGQHLLGLVNDVLDVSKIEAGKLSVECVACDIARQVNDAIDTFRPRAGVLGLDLIVRIRPDVPKLVMTDPLRLRQILTNLIGNALKFTQRGGITVDVSIEPRPGRTPLLRLDVSDTGRGIPASELAGIFDRFGHGSAAGRKPGAGSGLGLTISRNLARLLGGDIVASSQEGVGSRFAVTVDAGETAGHAAAIDPARSADTDRPLEGRHFLVAEDVVDTRTYLCSLLQRWGATTEVVEDGQAALERGLAGMNSFDGILMDVQMPRLDGLTATARLRAGGYHGPIVALTANALVGDRDACLAAGCTEYASKPLNASRLLETIRRAHALIGDASSGTDAGQLTPAG